MAARVTAEELEELRRQRFRRVYAMAYALRQLAGPRTGRRGLEDALRLAALAREASSLLLEVVEWGAAARRLRLRSPKP